MSHNKEEYYKNEIVHSLAEAIQRGGRSLQSVPGLLRKLIQEDLWVKRDVNGEIIEYDKAEFKSFVEAKYPEGLNTDIDTLKRLCADDIELIDFIAAANQGKVGRPPKHTDNKNTGNPSILSDSQVNNNSYHLNRLRDQAPEYHAKVMSGELSVNAAMVEAGFKPKKVSVNMDNPQSAFGTLTKHMSEENLKALIDLLNDWKD